MRQQSKKNKLTTQGFTLIELVVAVAILGILSSIALPSLFNQLYRSKQQACAAEMSLAMTTSLNFYNENGYEAADWADLNEINAVMTVNGPASNPGFSEIQISNDYKMSASKSQADIYNFLCSATNPAASNYDVKGCMRLLNGALQINLGDASAPAKTTVCI
jgi:prepilin-type N-terminal cleavage/methylation domain-containing protein